MTLTMRWPTPFNRKQSFALKLSLHYISGLSILWKNESGESYLCAHFYGKSYIKNINGKSEINILTH